MLSRFRGARWVTFLFLAAMTTMATGADVSAPSRPTKIIDGFEVEPCAWPTAVYLHDASGEICTGVYIGGRIVLTAAHCFSGGYVTEISCEIDNDCPTEDEFGNLLALTCDAESNGHCSDLESLVINDVPDILFGERYPNDDGHPRRTIPAQYCRRQSDGEGIGDDFAYCVLSEAPALQPVPMMMHCEVEQFLTEGTRVVAVGFGNEGGFNMPKPHGTKHYLDSSIAVDVSLLGDSLVLTPWTGAEPGASIAKGDSGGPLFAQLPDGTWRVIGVANRAPAFYEPVWSNVEWMLEDDNVANEQDELLPCHTPEGVWAPTAACGDFPLSPDLPAGDWTRGPFACNHEVSGRSETCGAPFGSFNLANPTPDPPMHPEKP